MRGPRCDHDVHPRACGICMGLHVAPVTDLHDVGPQIDARFDGWCHECGAPVDEGQPIRWAAGGWTCCY